MANRKQVSIIHTIVTLYGRKWPKLRIARHLGIDVKTVRRYIREAEAAGEPGAPGDSKSLLLPPGNAPPKSLLLPPGISGRASRCEPYREQIEQSLEAGLSAQRIYQDLVDEAAFAGGYDSVKRFVRKLKSKDPKRIWRMECLPGEEAQVDFGVASCLTDAKGRRRRANIFRITLSFSRKSYSESVEHQETESFIRCIENAFRVFGGVPQTLCIDNLRAAVKRADWYEPELNPKIESFCRHYGTAVLPTRVRTPEHKGKVESAVKYVKNNALKGRRFASRQELNQFLRDWEQTVADGRIHGTTRQQVRKRFEEVEKAALSSLPSGIFPCFSEGRRKVHRDSYVEVAKAYYLVPTEYISQEVWARWDSRTVRIFNTRFEQIAVLARKPPGTFSSSLSARGRPSASVEHDKGYWLHRCALLGDHCGVWALEVVCERGAPGIRVLQGLVQMAGKHPLGDLDRACKQAISHGAYRLADLRRLIEQPSQQESLPFMDQHPLIRDMSEYASFLEALMQKDKTPTEETVR